MKKIILMLSVSLSLLLAWMAARPVLAGQASRSVLDAKREAENRGYVFFSNRDEVVAHAKQEGRLRVVANMEPATIKAATQAFGRKYPFINLHVQEITGADERSILEIKSGRASDWDIVHPRADFYSEVLPYLWKVDLRGMAEHGILQIPPPMIDPKNRNIAAFYTRAEVISYNKNLVPPDRVPKAWEDFLKPEFKGKKFATDIIPTEVACLVPAWGLEKTLEFARKLAAQQPLWVRGGSRTLTAMMTGEIPIMFGPAFHTVRRAQSKDRAGVLQYVAAEPVPVRFHSEQAILARSSNPHAALLWMEWMAGAESQKLADEHEPLGSSYYFRGGAVEQEVRGKKLSWVSWEHHNSLAQWQSAVFEAYGFPKVGK